MADRVVAVDVRAEVLAWPADAPRGAVTQFCRAHNVSRSWFYEVRQRAASEPALQVLQPRQRSRPVRHPQAVAAAIEDLAVQIRKDLADEGLDHGPVTVRWHLQQAGLKAPAASTLARIFTARGLVVPQPQKRPKTSYRRFCFTQAHECWQLDAFTWPLADDTTVAVFQLSDDCTRLAVATHVAAGESAVGARAVVAAGIAAYQVPVLLLTDNGAAFNRDRMGQSTQLSAYLRGLGCKPITGRPAHPQTQGKNERIHQTLQRWLRARPPAATIAELQALCEEFDEIYNHHRPHQALGMRTPAQALAQAIAAVPPQPPAVGLKAWRQPFTEQLIIAHHAKPTCRVHRCAGNYTTLPDCVRQRQRILHCQSRAETQLRAHRMRGIADYAHRSVRESPGAGMAVRRKRELVVAHDLIHNRR